MTQWTQAQIPDQTGKVALITGSNSGIGFEAAKALAAKGAEVILACRSEARGNDAIARIRAEQPDAKLGFLQLDLADLDQVAEAAAAFRAEHDQLHYLINNAGVMVPPERSETQQGFELQLGVNHLGHFALTGHLLEVLQATPGSRVVNVSSMAHRQGRMNWNDLHWQGGYKKWASYGQSKLANLLFTLELNQRGVEATAAHPGWTATNLQRHTGVFEKLNPLFAMPAWQGALPTLHAAVAAEPGQYIGPNGLMESRGYPAIAKRTKYAENAADAARLWEISEELTGVRYLSEARARAA